MLLRQLIDRETCTYTYLLADEDSREALAAAGLLTETLDVKAAVRDAHRVSPPNGGMSTPRNIVIAGGSGRNGESKCQPEPKMIATGSSACLMTG